MKRTILSLFSLVTVFYCAAIPAAFGQGRQLPEPPNHMKRMYAYGRLQGAETRMAELMSQSSSATTIPLWNYTTTSSRDGLTYPGTMVGRSPFFHGHRSTSVPVFIIPVKFTFTSDGTIFDPTTDNAVSDTICTSSGKTVQTVVQNSPIFQNSTYTMNGVNVGSAQYIDAFERANFWSDVKGTPYHTQLGSVTTLAAVNVTVPVANGSTQAGFCRNLGLIDINWWDPALNGGVGDGEAGVILASLKSKGVGPTSLPIFLFDSVVMYIGNTVNCCILGYHNAFLTSGTGLLQTFSVSAWDNSGSFGGDITTFAHEVGEWMDDPMGTNGTPLWGHVGQVTGCQGNLEVGDPLSGTSFPPVMQNGFTYNPQELAFYSWFYGTPSIGAGGKFSNNGTFTTDAGPKCM